MIRDTIKTRTIYDALPVSFRLILLDTNLLVKKALHCLIQNSTSDPLSPLKTNPRHCVRPAMELARIHVCRPPHSLRLYQRHKILLPKVVPLLRRSNRPHLQTQTPWPPRRRTLNRCVSPRNPQYRPPEIALRCLSEDAYVARTTDSVDRGRHGDEAGGCDFGDDAVPDSQVCCSQSGEMDEFVAKEDWGFEVGDV